MQRSIKLGLAIVLASLLIGFLFIALFNTGEVFGRGHIGGDECVQNADCGSSLKGSCVFEGGSCDNTGTRAVYPRVCSNGSCVLLPKTTESCFRDTAGNVCGTLTGKCGGFSDSCDQTGTKAVYDKVCSGGSCSDFVKTGTQSCSRDVPLSCIEPPQCPAPLFLSHDAAVSSLTVRWSAISGAKTYLAQLNDISSGLNTVYYGFTENTQYTFSGLLSENLYRFLVRVATSESAVCTVPGIWYSGINIETSNEPAPSSIVPEPSFCDDPDAQDKTVQGSCFDDQGGPLTDVCLTNNTLREYYCGGNKKCDFIDTFCPQGTFCSQGACLPENILPISVISSPSDNTWFEEGLIEVSVLDSDTGGSGLDTNGCRYSVWDAGRNVWNLGSGTYQGAQQRSCNGKISVSVGKTAGDCQSQGPQACQVFVYSKDYAGNISQTLEATKGFYSIDMTLPDLSIEKILSATGRPGNFLAPGSWLKADTYTVVSEKVYDPLVNGYASGINNCWYAIQDVKTGKTRFVSFASTDCGNPTMNFKVGEGLDCEHDSDKRGGCLLRFAAYDKAGNQGVHEKLLNIDTTAPTTE